jgi:hypothetical protein
VHRPLIALPVFFVAGLVVGVGIYAILGPDRASIPAPVQAALITVTGAVIAGAAAAVGVTIGARIAADEGAAGRADTRRERFRDKTRGLAADLMRESALHEREVSAEVAWRASPTNKPWELRQKPALGSTEPLAAVAQELRITSELRETARQARRVYSATLALDAAAFMPQVDLVDPDHVRPISDAVASGFTNQRAVLHGERRTFVRLVRQELGLQPFDDEWEQ